MTLRYPDLESVKKEITTEIHAYVDAVTVLGSLRQYLRDMNIECYIEKKLQKIKGGHKTPDLLIHSRNFLIVDHKYSESDDEKTLSSKIDEMEEYKTTFVASDPESQEPPFKPEIVMLTPREITKYFKKINNCPITWGYKAEEEITIEQSIGSIVDSSILSLFNPILLCPVAEEVGKYKFIISHAPLPYTAYQIYTMLWNLHPPRQFFSPEFDVRYDLLLNAFNYLFPPWISPEIKQLNTGRLREALLFLQDIGWIRWLETEQKVIIYRSKGRYLGDLLGYLVDHYVKTEHGKRVKEFEKTTELKAGFQQKELGDFIS